ncbi:hypothetical protein K469DRAFT_686701 [Zopfia rhizophila CBS 207.26]|uniref:Uncharacterized protein n=1 Tax=Zopfia rhizophila CBS 207.26 TaxID=1314779 RepID=A0A6A6EUP4_9PEZI|nr:hypothetical protein K469DRAFT_686701 [Zopfia rhizophila CBS 207.26]
MSVHWATGTNFTELQNLSSESGIEESESSASPSSANDSESEAEYRESEIDSDEDLDELVLKSLPEPPRHPRIRSALSKVNNRENYTKDGVKWAIDAWRFYLGYPQYILKYSLPGSKDEAYSLIWGKDLPNDLLLHYNHEESSWLDKKGQGRENRDPEFVMGFAWSSYTEEPFTPNPQWDKCTSDSLDPAMFDEMFALVRWDDGKKTWETGTMIAQLKGLDAFLRWLPDMVTGTRKRWAEIRKAASSIQKAASLGSDPVGEVADQLRRKAFFGDGSRARRVVHTSKGTITRR